MTLTALRPARSIIIAALAAMLAASGLPGAATAYIEQAPFQVLLSGPGRTVRCDRTAQISATVLSTADGSPVRRQTVRWGFAQSQSPGDSLSAQQTTTDARGRTSVTVSFGPVAGTRRISASASIVTATIEIRCAGGLPETFTAAPGGVEAARASLEVAARHVAPPAVPDSAMGLVDPGTVATRLRIDRLGMDLPIVAGNGVDVPESAAAHYPGTAWPGAGSNTFLYAHNREGLFGELWRVRTGDLVSVTLEDGSLATYRVSEIRPMVAWDDLDTLAPTTSERLTLQTCLTYAPDAPRFVVIADRVDHQVTDPA